MVFFKFAAGLAFGVALPMYCHENLYLVIATSFLRPHLKYRIEAAKRTRDQATSTQELDSYFRDIFKSFSMFWLVIGPVLYKTYYLKEELFPQDGYGKEAGIVDVEDRAVTILKQIKAPEGEKELLRITFEDYERLMKQLEADGKSEQLRAINPRAQLSEREAQVRDYEKKFNELMSEHKDL